MFSRNLRVINRREDEEVKARQQVEEKPEEKPAAPLSKAQKAKEYASRVPKPRLREPSAPPEAAKDEYRRDDEVCRTTRVPIPPRRGGG